MDKIPPDCLEVIARSIATSDKPWLCDVVTDAASLSLAGNETCAALSRFIQEAVEPGCSSSPRRRHFHLSNTTRWACDESRKQKRWMELEGHARLIEYSERAWAIANMYADSGDAGCVAALVEMDARMAELRGLLEDRGCSLRSDSAVCRAFIEEGIGHPPSIADTMEEMKFFFEHTEYRYHMQSWHFSELAKEVALTQWVMEHGAFSPLLPASLRDAAAEVALKGLLDPLRVPPDLRKEALELIRGLGSVDALKRLQSQLGARMEAVEAALERITGWGRDAVAFFGTENDTLMADEDTYRRRRASAHAAWARGEFSCPTCQKIWGTARQLADHFLGKHGVVPAIQ